MVVKHCFVELLLSQSLNKFSTCTKKIIISINYQFNGESILQIKKKSLKKNLICSQKSEFLDEESFIYKSQAL